MKIKSLPRPRQALLFDCVGGRLVFAKLLFEHSAHDLAGLLDILSRWSRVAETEAVARVILRIC